MRLVLSSLRDRATEDKRREEPSRRAAKTSRREDVATDATEVTQSDDDDIDVRAFLTCSFSQPPVAEVLGQVAEGLVDGVVPGPFKGVLGARAEHGLVRGERRLGRGGRRERVRERARGAPEGTLRRGRTGRVKGFRGVRVRTRGGRDLDDAPLRRARVPGTRRTTRRGAGDLLRKPRASIDRVFRVFDVTAREEPRRDRYRSSVRANAPERPGKRARLR